MPTEEQDFQRIRQFQQKGQLKSVKNFLVSIISDGIFTSNEKVALTYILNTINRIIAGYDKNTRKLKG